MEALNLRDKFPVNESSSQIIPSAPAVYMQEPSAGNDTELTPLNIIQLTLITVLQPKQRSALLF